MRLIFFLAAIVLLIGCSYQKPIKEAELLQQEKFVLIDTLSQQLNYSIHKSDENLTELRLWVKYEVTNFTEMHAIKDLSSGSQLNHYYMWENIENSFQLDSAKIVFGNGKTSARNLIEQVYDFEFKELGNQSDSIASLTGDGVTYYLEIKDKSYYKRIYYNNPHAYNDVNNKKFISVLSLLESELSY